MVQDALARAMSALDDNQSEMARICGVAQPTVFGWLKSRRVGAEYVLAVESATGISRHALRPDIFGPAPQSKAQTATRREAA